MEPLRKIVTLNASLTKKKNFYIYFKVKQKSRYFTSTCIFTKTFILNNGLETL